MESGFYSRKGDKNMSDMCTDNHMTSYSSFDETELQLNILCQKIREDSRVETAMIENVNESTITIMFYR